MKLWHCPCLPITEAKLVETREFVETTTDKSSMTANWIDHRPKESNTKEGQKIISTTARRGHKPHKFPDEVVYG